MQEARQIGALRETKHHSSTNSELSVPPSDKPNAPTAGLICIAVLLWNAAVSMYVPGNIPKISNYNYATASCGGHDLRYLATTKSIQLHVIFHLAWRRGSRSEIVRRAVLNAASIILSHNHASDDASPSQAVR